MVATVVDVNELPKRFDELMEFAKTGGSVVIGKNGQRAQLLPLPEAKPLVLGLNAGTVEMSEDFDAPLPEEFWTGPP